MEKPSSHLESKNVEHALLPFLVDQKGSSTPEALWVEYPRDPDTYDHGYAGITYRQLSSAVNGAAWWLEHSLGRGHFETLAYMGPNDARYQILLIAAIKAGYKIFLTSPRNSVPAQIQLFEDTGCRMLLLPEPRPPPAITLLNEHEMKTLMVPDLKTLLYEDYDHYPYDKSHQQCFRDPIFVLHTSGSTGVPKPLVYTHEWIASSVAISNLNPPTGYSSFNALHHKARIILLLPSFHIAGVYFSVINGIYNNATTILPLPTEIPTASSLSKILEHTNADSAFTPPSILEDLSKDLILLHNVAPKLSLLFWSGGPLAQAAGSILSAHTRLHTCYGSSEYGAWPEVLLVNQSLSLKPSCLSLGKDCWCYFRLHPALNAKFRHRGDNRFELVLPRDPSRTEYLTPFSHFPHLRAAYHTRDLFEPHPSYHDFWTHVGRVDDIIIFSNGEKTNPVEYEARVVADAQPFVSAALVFGTGRAEAGILVEQPPGLIIKHEPVWSAVQKANVASPTHARVAKEMILFTEKPFVRAGKGTVQREPTLRIHAEQIDRRYAETSGVKDLRVEKPSSGISRDRITNLVRQICRSDPTLDPDANFFTALGMDSLQVTQLSRALRNELGRVVEPFTIVENPTVRKLEEALRER